MKLRRVLEVPEFTLWDTAWGVGFPQPSDSWGRGDMVMHRPRAWEAFMEWAAREGAHGSLNCHLGTTLSTEMQGP